MDGAPALFDTPYAVATGTDGSVYVTDSKNNLIRKVTASGTVSTIAGSLGVTGSSDGTGVNASFNTPLGIAVDGSNNIYVADTGNDTIRKISPSGVVTTLAGVAGEAGSLDGYGTEALFSSPEGLALDSNGNLYVADTGNNLIRKITPAGAVSTVAGDAGVAGTQDGAEGDAQFYDPTALTLDGSGNIYVADSGNDTIRKINVDNIVSTIAGTPQVSGTVDGPGGTAQFNYPAGITTDGTGNLYVSDFGNHTIRTISSSLNVTTIFGAAGQSGTTNAVGTAARFNYPAGLTSITGSNFYVADSRNDEIREITLSGSTSTLAGSPETTGTVDGLPATTGQFNDPTGVAVLTTGSNAGKVYIADTANDAIRLVGTSGSLGTIAGMPGISGTANGAAKTAAQFNLPSGLAIISDGNLYIADTGNNTIRKLTSSGTSVTITTVAGTPGMSGTVDGMNGAALFNAPSGIALDGSGNLWVADTGNDVIREITFTSTNAKVTTVAGIDGTPGDVDAAALAAQFNSPMGLAFDHAGNLYIADSKNAAIRMLSSGTGGTVSTIISGPTNQSGNAALFSRPEGIAVDTSTNIYVTDSGESTITKITPLLVVTTIGGSDGVLENVNGTSAQSRFYKPVGIAVDSSTFANIYVADAGNNRIANGKPIPEISVTQNFTALLSSGTSTSNFGVVPIRDSTLLTYVITNAGAAPLNLISVTGSGTDASDFIVGTPSVSGTLQPGASSTVTVTFSPLAGGTRTAVLYIASSDPYSGVVPVDLVGTAIASGDPSLAVEEGSGNYLTNGQSTASFGSVFEKGSQTIQFEIANEGIGDLSNLALAVTGSDPSDFSFSAISEASIASGSTATFDVTFTPTATGARSATLHITSNDPNQPEFTIPLTGTGNSYAPLAGSYAGLIDNNNGSISLTFSSGGQFTGQLIFDGVKYAIIGALDSHGNFSGSTQGAFSPLTGYTLIPITISANIAGGTTATNGTPITGTVNGTDFFTAYGKQVFTKQKAKAYNVLFQPTESGTLIPQGNGYARLMVTAAGAATLVGDLADATKFSIPCILTGGTNNTLVVVSEVTSAYELTGDISISGSTCTGLLFWVKDPVTKVTKAVPNPPYKGGFNTTLAVTGALYTAPKAGKPAIVFDTTNSAVAAITGYFGAPAVGPLDLSAAISVAANSAITVTSTNELIIHLTPATGLFSGSLELPGAKTSRGVAIKTTFAGAVVTNPAAPIAGGFFLTPVNTGTSTILSGTSFSDGITITP
jgi:sugar lactone lactonase YvrE